MIESLFITASWEEIWVSDHNVMEPRTTGIPGPRDCGQVPGLAMSDSWPSTANAIASRACSGTRSPPSWSPGYRQGAFPDHAEERRVERATPCCDNRRDRRPGQDEVPVGGRDGFGRERGGSRYAVLEGEPAVFRFLRESRGEGRAVDLPTGALGRLPLEVGVLHEIDDHGLAHRAPRCPGALGVETLGVSRAQGHQRVDDHVAGAGVESENPLGLRSLAGITVALPMPPMFWTMRPSVRDPKRMASM